MRIFLTGANGFVGGAVASALIADGHVVRGVSFVTRPRPTRLQLMALMRSSGRSTTRRCCKTKPRGPMASSMQPIAVTAAP